MALWRAQHATQQPSLGAALPASAVRGRHGKGAGGRIAGGGLPGRRERMPLCGQLCLGTRGSTRCARACLTKIGQAFQGAVHQGRLKVHHLSGGHARARQGTSCSITVVYSDLRLSSCTTTRSAALKGVCTAVGYLHSAVESRIF